MENKEAKWSLLDRINAHLRQLAPHQKERDGVVLLTEARDELARLKADKLARLKAQEEAQHWIQQRSLSNAGLGLLPCPFCGSEPKTWWDIKHEDECYCEGFNISCTRCDSVSKCCIDKIDAIAAWNTRA